MSSKGGQRVQTDEVNREVGRGLGWLGRNRRMSGGGGMSEHQAFQDKLGCHRALNLEAMLGQESGSGWDEI